MPYDNSYADSAIELLSYFIEARDRARLTGAEVPCKNLSLWEVSDVVAALGRFYAEHPAVDKPIPRW